MKNTILVFLLAISFHNCFAQASANQTDDKLYDHYVGAQIGPLIMHLFNSSANSIGSGNPYIITYSMNNRETGWGIRAGIGCNFLTNSTATSYGNTTTSNNDLEFRAGVEKIFEITDKWNAGAGVDITVNYNNDETSATNNQAVYDTNTTINKTLSLNYGGGLFGKINYHLSKKILLGTECSYYYVVGKNNQTAELVQRNGGSPPTTTESKSNPAYSKGAISYPIVIYLLLKF